MEHAVGREQGTATPLLEGVRASNAAHLAHLVSTVRRLAPPPGPILQLGLSFKTGTDDLRNSPLVDLAEELAQAGYELRILDPDVDPARLLGVNFAWAAEHRANVLSRLAGDLAAAADGARLAVLGKPMPGMQERLPRALPVLDASRLRLGHG